MPAKITRRRMLGHSALSAIATLSPQFIARGAQPREAAPAANGRIGVAIIGCGRRGDNYLAGGLPARTQIVATST